MGSQRTRARLDRACKKPKASAPTPGFMNPQVQAVANPQPGPVPGGDRRCLGSGLRSSRVWELTCWQFNEEYKKKYEHYAGAAELLQTADRPHVHLPKVLPLNTRYDLPDGTFTTLICCISSTMPPHLYWSPFTGKMEDATAIQDTVDNMKERFRAAQEAKEEREMVRRELKKQRRRNISNNMECKRQFLRAQAEQNGEEFDSDDVSEEGFSDGPVSDSD
ncbi:hypothetical protein BKA64DRAFT_648160 [Cadophora sp. MPI-SDFR-AT-0126]|nr:hypothetical protein BKA64DRAFT_648160 [Leotiomycetes sp. MPI-SDFR-AT-0126]